jgi:hypothetical protein
MKSPMNREQRNYFRNTEPKVIGGRIVRVPLRRKVGLIGPRLTARQKRMSEENLAVDLMLNDQITEATLVIAKEEKELLENPPVTRGSLAEYER